MTTEEESRIGYYPSLAEALQDDIKSLEKVRTFSFSISAEDEVDAFDKAKKEMGEAFGVDPSEVNVGFVEKMMELDSFTSHFQCSGKTNRFETVCWVPRTPWKQGAIFNNKSENIAKSEAMEAMDRMFQIYDEKFAGNTIKVGKRNFKFPPTERSGFECALNRTVDKCKIGVAKEPEGNGVFSVIAENPIYEEDL